MDRDRHKRMLKLLAEHGSATVMQLGHWLGVSEATVRRDLRHLVAAQHLQRHRGVARIVSARPVPQLHGQSFHANSRLHWERKRAIARRAAQLCADGDTVLISGGTTTYHLADFLAGRAIRILTNSFELARQVLVKGDNDVIVFGGTVYRDQGVVLSPFDSSDIRYSYAHHLFMGMHCISSLGMMEADPLLIQSSQSLFPQAQQITVLADSSKFIKRGGMFVCALNKITRVITDTHAPDAAVQMLERAGVQVLLAHPEPTASANPPLIN